MRNNGTVEMKPQDQLQPDHFLMLCLIRNLVKASNDNCDGSGKTDVTYTYV